jgi:hypothetical protein
LPETVRNGIFARLWRLPRDLLLALINATALLVIVAAILVLLAIVRIDNFAGNVAATMTDAVLSKIDLPSKDVLANLRRLREEVRTLDNTLREIRAGENPILRSETARLRDALMALNVSVDRLANASTILTDEAIRQVSRSVTDTLTRMRGCASPVGQTQHIGRLGDGAAATGQVLFDRNRVANFVAREDARRWAWSKDTWLGPSVSMAGIPAVYNLQMDPGEQELFAKVGDGMKG